MFYIFYNQDGNIKCEETPYEELAKKIVREAFGEDRSFYIDQEMFNRVVMEGLYGIATGNPPRVYYIDRLLIPIEGCGVTKAAMAESSYD